MFAAISLNWRGRPLTTYETILELIGATTKTGLTIECVLDCNSYATGIKVTDEELAAVNLTHPDDQNLQWDYTIRPRLSTSKNGKS